MGAGPWLAPSDITPLTIVPSGLKPKTNQKTIRASCKIHKNCWSVSGNGMVLGVLSP